MLLSNASSSGVPSISQPVSNLRKLHVLVPKMIFQMIFDQSNAAFSSIVARYVKEDKIVTSMKQNISNILFDVNVNGHSTDSLLFNYNHRSGAENS